MKKNVNFYFFCVGLLVMTLMQVGCSSDDEEQISLDYDNVCKIIVGTWYVDGTGRTLIFTDDGFYTDSSVGGITRLQWKLEDISDDDGYSYRLWLYKTLYELYILDNDHWRLKSGNGNVMDLTRDGKYDGDDSGNVSDGDGKLVSKITVYEGNN